MRLLVVAMLLLSSMVQATETTYCGLKYGNYEYENDNWNIIDWYLCGPDTQFTCSSISECSICEQVADCLPPTQCVATLGQACDQTWECCTGFCANGLCVLSACVNGIGGACATSADCCEGFCFGAVCVGIAPTTTTSTSTSTSTSSSTSSSTSTSTLNTSTTTSTSSTTSTSTSTSTTSTTLNELNGQVCVTIEQPSGDDDNVDIWFPVDVSTTLILAGCHCTGTCGSTVATFTFLDRNSNVISISPNPLTCSTGSSLTSYTTISTGDADRILVAGEGVRFTVNNDPTTAQTARVTLCVTY